MFTAVSNDAAWITVSWFEGDTVVYTVAANTSGADRTGTITVAGLTFTVNQSGLRPCINYTYSPWLACINGKNIRTVISRSPEGCFGEPDPAQLTRDCPPCTDYTYSSWSACGSDGFKTRYTTGKIPLGCDGQPPNPPVTDDVCIPPCTDYTYSPWSACGSDGFKTRHTTGKIPSGCDGEPSKPPETTQSCTPPVPTCPSNYPVACPDGYCYLPGSVCCPSGGAYIPGVSKCCAGGWACLVAEVCHPVWGCCRADQPFHPLGGCCPAATPYPCGTQCCATQQ